MKRPSMRQLRAPLVAACVAVLALCGPSRAEADDDPKGYAARASDLTITMDYDKARAELAKADPVLRIPVRQLVENGDGEIPVVVGGREITTLLEVSDRQRQELLAGGTLNFVKQNQH